MLAPYGLVLLLSGAGLTVQGQGEGGCPSAADVSARLGALLPGEGGGEPPGSLVLDADAGALRVRLLTPQGSVREQRRLELRGSCAELADAVATVAVAWQSTLRSDDVPPPVLPARATAVVAAPAVTAAAPAVAPRAPGHRTFDDALELAVGFHTAGGSRWWAPGVSLAGQAPLGRRFSWAMELTVDWPRTTFAAGKRWTWLQLSLIAAPSYRIVTRSLLWDVRVGLASDVTFATSESVHSRNSYQLMPPSAVVGLRVTYPRSNHLPWFGATFATQLARELVSPVRGTFIEPERWMLGLAVGATFEVERFR